MTTHGCKSNGDPPCRSMALELTLSLHSDRLLYCLDPSVPSLFYPPPMFVSERIFAYLPSYADGFCRRTCGKWEAHAKTVDCLHPFVVKGFCEFGFLRVSQSVITSTALVGGLLSENSVNGGTCEQQEKQRLSRTKRMLDC